MWPDMAGKPGFKSAKTSKIGYTGFSMLLSISKRPEGGGGQGLLTIFLSENEDKMNTISFIFFDKLSSGNK